MTKIPEIRDGDSVSKDEASDLAWFSFFLGIVVGAAGAIAGLEVFCGLG